MQRTKKSVSPSVDAVEPRVLLSATAPLVGQHTLNAVARDVRAIMSTLGRTENTARASARLTRLSSRIPSGREGLAPSWRQDLAVYNPRAAVSVVAAQNLILGDLYRYVGSGSGGGKQPVTGSGSTTSPTPTPGTGGTGGPVSAPSLDSVKIQNTTGIAIRVTIYLDVPQVQKPWITMTIPAQGTTTAPFNFGTATDAFMTMDVSRADGGQSPPPFTNFSLPQPMGGYNAALFKVSVFGSSFNITPA